MPCREAQPGWFYSNRMLGGVCYVNLFSGDLTKMRSKIPYFKELGITYLHLMPLFQVPADENDGGYAVSSYREVDADAGQHGRTWSTWRTICATKGSALWSTWSSTIHRIEHEWAQARPGWRARFPGLLHHVPRPEVCRMRMRSNLREIFPDEHPGAFTYRKEIDRWVWTTFHSYQWDLNYANPVVFNRMAEEMLFLANLGVEVLRLDAVAFIWKQLGTSCENLPEAHLLIQAFNAVARIAAPALLFKSEAIVHPDDVARYIRPDECQLSYNPLLMALLWNTLATREVNLLDQALRRALQARLKGRPG